MNTTIESSIGPVILFICLVWVVLGVNRSLRPRPVVAPRARARSLPDERIRTIIGELRRQSYKRDVVWSDDLGAKYVLRRGQSWENLIVTELTYLMDTELRWSAARVDVEIYKIPDDTDMPLRLKEYAFSLSDRLEAAVYEPSQARIDGVDEGSTVPLDATQSGVRKLERLCARLDRDRSIHA